MARFEGSSLQGIATTTVDASNTAERSAWLPTEERWGGGRVEHSQNKTDCYELNLLPFFFGSMKSGSLAVFSTPSMVALMEQVRQVLLRTCRRPPILSFEEEELLTLA